MKMPHKIFRLLKRIYECWRYAIKILLPTYPTSTSNTTKVDERHMAKLTTVTEARSLLELLPDIRNLSESEKPDPQFLHSNAIRTAILKNNIVALVDEASHKPILAGYVWWNGIFPKARIQAIAISKSFCRNEVSATLINDLVSYLQKLGFMTLQANLAEDVSTPSHFYEQPDFYPLESTDSDENPKRRNSVYVRDVQPKNLDADASFHPARLRIQTNSSVDHPIFVLDSSVYFDLVLLKHLASEARKLFSASLNNIIRLAIDKEFVLKLQKSNFERPDRSIFEMAQDLPRLTEGNSDELNALGDRIHNRLFVEQNLSNANTQRSTSCSNLIAKAVLCRALAFVTSNNEILRYRELLINEFGIDVISIDDLIQLVTDLEDRKSHRAQHVEKFTISIPSQSEISEYFACNDVQKSIVREFSNDSKDDIDRWSRCFRINGKICGVAVLLTPQKPNSVRRLTIYCDENNLHKDLFAEHLLDLSLKEASRNGVCSIEIELPANQPTLSALANSKGFNTSIVEPHYRKVAIGRLHCR